MSNNTPQPDAELTYGIDPAAPNGDYTGLSILSNGMLYTYTGDEADTLIKWADRRTATAVYNFHEYIMGKGIIRPETDQAFNYARLHRAIDEYVAALRPKEDGDAS